MTQIHEGLTAAKAEGVIGVDIDGVCADLLQTWLVRYNKYYDDHLTKRDITAFDMATQVKPEARTAIYAILKEPDLYEDVLPIQGACLGVRALRQYVGRVVFITACARGSAFEQKISWMLYHGFMDGNANGSWLQPHDFVACSDKRLLAVPTLIDDRAESVQEFTATGRHGLLYHSNRNQSGLHWCDIVQVIKELET